MSNFKQFVYGKRTESTTGPILGSDYECTGKSDGFPLQLEEYCRPFVTGPGIDEHTPWHEYKWAKQGGYAVSFLNVEGENWMLASQTIGRSEKGVDVPGRIYTQAHFLALRFFFFGDSSLLCAF